MEPPHISIASNLPDGWAPDGTSVFVVARLDNDGVWESVVPEFSIAGRGGSADDAVGNALELLDDYLMLCARDGKSFEEARRGMSPRSTLPMVAELVGIVTGRKLARRPRQRRDREYRIPLNVVGAH